VLEAGPCEGEQRLDRLLPGIGARRELELRLVGDQPPDGLRRVGCLVELCIGLEPQRANRSPADELATQDPGALGIGADRRVLVVEQADIGRCRG
jgi:hypothetical protein